MRRRVSERQALEELPPEVVSLVNRLSQRGWEIRHGGQQTHLIYKGHGLGGINRKWGFGYLSKLIAPVVGPDKLKALGFRERRLKSERSTFFGHSWFDVVLPGELAAFGRVLDDLAAMIDTRCLHD